MSDKAFIGIDLGGESGRVVAGQFDGERIHLSEKHRFTTGGFDLGGTLRWDVDRFWNEIKRGLSIVARDKITATSIGVDTWGVDYVLLDENDAMLEVPWHYRDSRNQGMLQEVTTRVDRSEIFSQTGIQFMEINTLYQLAAARKNRDVLDRAKHFLMIPDYLNWRLTGSKAVEFTNATTTQCFDPTQRHWARPLLEKLDIPTAMLPDTVEPGCHLGMLRTEVCQETGLGSTAVVAPATHDTGSAVVAVPADSSVAKNWAYISSGTWSLVGVEVDQPVLSAEALAANVTNEGGVDGTWRLLKNVMGLWIVQQTKAAFSRRGFDRSYAELANMAAAAGHARSFIDPDSPCFLHPQDMEQALYRFCGQTGQAIPHDEGCLMRCILESLALRYTQVLKEIENLSGARIDVVHVVGGGSQHALLNQLLANAAQISVIAGPVEATVLGNVMVQCRAAGDVSSLAEIREVVRKSSSLTSFEPHDHEDWQTAMDRFRRVVSS